MKILLVEDSRIEQLKIGRFLADWRLDFAAVANGTEAVTMLEGADPPHMVLLDWMLPDLDGIDVCRHIRTNGARLPYIYIVMLTAKSRKQDLLRAMAAGADDYLPKPVDPSDLRARIMAGKRILDLQHSLRFAATHDFLTNLLNRSEILAALERELSRSRREDKRAPTAANLPPMPVRAHKEDREYRRRVPRDCCTPTWEGQRAGLSQSWRSRP